MTPAEKFEAYKKWCREHDLPNFVPPSGKCFGCRNEVFGDTKHTKGAEPDEFVTGCPHCHRTFCD